MRILHVTPHLRVGGAERLIAQLSRIQQERPGWEVAVAAEPGAVVDDLAVPFFALPCHSGRVARAWAWKKALAQLVTRFHPDVVHTHAFQTTLPHLSVLRGRIAVLTLHNSLVSRELMGAAVATTFPLHVAFVSSYSAGRVKRIVPRMRRTRVYAIPNGVDTDFWTYVPHRPEGSPVVLWVGRLCQDKNPLAAIDVFEQMAAALPEARLALAGDGVLRQALDERVEASPVRSRIDLYGEQPPLDLRELYRSASVMLNTSHHEGLPLSLLEGLATGLVPVAPRLPTLVSADLAGAELYVPYDWVAAADSVLRILQSGERPKMSVRSIRSCERDYADLYSRAGAHAWLGV